MEWAGGQRMFLPKTRSELGYTPRWDVSIGGNAAKPPGNARLGKEIGIVDIPSSTSFRKLAGGLQPGIALTGRQPSGSTSALRRHVLTMSGATPTWSSI